MKRALVPGLLLLCLVSGCQLPPERQALRLLPEDATPLTYFELITRARYQATAGNEAFYVNRWADLEDAARALEQTARFLPKALEIPPRHKDTLAADAALGKDAVRLREAARDKDVKQASEILQRLQLKIRELRVEA